MHHLVGLEVSASDAAAAPAVTRSRLGSLLVESSQLPFTCHAGLDGRLVDAQGVQHLAKLLDVYARAMQALKVLRLDSVIPAGGQQPVAVCVPRKAGHGRLVNAQGVQCLAKLLGVYARAMQAL